MHYTHSFPAAAATAPQAAAAATTARHALLHHSPDRQYQAKKTDGPASPSSTSHE